MRSKKLAKFVAEILMPALGFPKLFLIDFDIVIGVKDYAVAVVILMG